MPHRRYRIRPAEPHEVALALLDLVTVERRPPVSAREAVRTVLEGLVLVAGGTVATLLALIALGWLLTL
ncbi:hypothetical protein DFP74_6694 [Nocardiopsis sp. Huas11]|uniref:hypothetical protein n=1 Tax=Nocardiopsis sp. Huas11 TaxID=2183912 RepID=UPI000EABF58E|nr:hypothetical protein [Nocardiopsis sp. Huas11]RKR98973.1 hypothetical protein DFP74_6694 [Nocardiopsis sp. Huas11]